MDITHTSHLSLFSDMKPCHEFFIFITMPSHNIISSCAWSTFMLMDRKNMNDVFTLAFIKMQSILIGNNIFLASFHSQETFSLSYSVSFRGGILTWTTTRKQMSTGDHAPTCRVFSFGYFIFILIHTTFNMFTKHKRHLCWYSSLLILFLLVVPSRRVRV